MLKGTKLLINNPTYVGLGVVGARPCEAGGVCALINLQYTSLVV